MTGGNIGCSYKEISFGNPCHNSHMQFPNPQPFLLNHECIAEWKHIPWYKNAIATHVMATILSPTPVDVLPWTQVVQAHVDVSIFHIICIKRSSYHSLLRKQSIHFNSSLKENQ